MLKELKFVMGAVAKKDFVPSMKHFAIRNGVVVAYNGNLALSTPIDFNIDCNPKASQLVQAIARCEGTVVLSMTDNHKLRIQSDSFAAYVDCIEGENYPVVPEGEPYEIDGEQLLACVKKIYDFIGTDASRPWANGVLLRGMSAFATNNVMIVEYWLGQQVPIEINVPRDAIEEMIRIDEPPVRAQITPNSLSLHYENGRWIRMQLLATEWPAIDKILQRESNPRPIPEDLYRAIEQVKVFCDKGEFIFLQPGLVRTHLSEGEGATYDVPGLDFNGCYRYSMLLKLKDVATTADFTLYPQPCTFFGDRVRGVFIGVPT